jgi:hypothetical protein
MVCDVTYWMNQILQDMNANAIALNTAIEATCWPQTRQLAKSSWSARHARHARHCSDKDTRQPGRWCAMLRGPFMLWPLRTRGAENHHMQGLNWWRKEDSFDFKSLVWKTFNPENSYWHSLSNLPLLRQELIRDRIRSCDMLVISVGGNDITLAPSICTVLAMVLLKLALFRTGRWFDEM